MRKEVKVGEIVQYSYTKLKCEETPNKDCDGCFFDNYHICCTNKQISDIIGFCSEKHRKDNKNVIFVKVD